MPDSSGPRTRFSPAAAHAAASARCCLRTGLVQASPPGTGLDLINLVDLDPDIRALARTVAPVTVRSLDAIHLATALRIGGQLTSFVTYDKRLADAAGSRVSRLPTQ